MSVVNATVGAVTDTGATVAVKAEDGPVRVLVADNPGMSGGVFFGPESLDGNDATKVDITGLDPETRHWWQVEDDGVVDTSLTGQLLTHPPVGQRARVRFGYATCAGSNPDFPGEGSVLAASRLSNSPAFDHIRQRGLAEGWLFFGHGGDLHYYDLGSDSHGITGGSSVDNYRRAYDDVLAQPRQLELYSSIPWWYMWDDHDGGINNWDRTFAGKGNAQQVYRERIPHYALSDPDGIWQAREIGRVLIVAADVRSDRDPNDDPNDPDKTMLGAAQRAWMESLLETSDAKFLVWLMGDQWHRAVLEGDPGRDHWASFPDERDRLVEMFGDTGWLGRMLICQGDSHSMGISSGATNPFGGFPVGQFAPIDAQSSGIVQSLWDVGTPTNARAAFGSVDIEDLGPAIRVTMRGFVGASEVMSHTFTVATGDPPPATVANVAEFAPVVAGSHDVVAEAWVLTQFQSGADPDGVPLPILSGDVQLDATADVHATIQLDTVGVDPDTGRSWFPRLPGDLLSPYGHEVFVRRGVDLGGGGILWSPLGYFRIETVEQADDVEAPISISGSDRMAAVAESDVLTPREFPASTSVAAFFAAMVGDVYPDALVVFDDAAGFADLGRTIVVDESRHEPLAEVADGLGKVMFWDGEGILRIEDPPPDGEPVWTVKSGRNGVLVEASRRVTRVGAPNGVIVLGEGGGNDDPVRGVAVDMGPASPTRWAGPYGRVVMREQLSTVTTPGQAEQAAREILRRHLGAPHSADFGAMVNPALRPRMPILVVQRDGNRDRHIVETLTIPLTAAGTMQGTTRERTHVVIGSVIS